MKKYFVAFILMFSIGPAVLAASLSQSPVISELLPNPVRPQTDQEHEFIEIYNPAKKTYDLTGHSLRSPQYSYKFVKGASIPSGDHLVLYSAKTKILLNDQRDQVVLADPNGRVIFKTSPYSSAAAGKSWNLGTKLWYWAQPTPGWANNKDSWPSK